MDWDESMGWDELIRAWETMDFLEGWRPEITERGIVMTPPPNVGHTHIASLIDRDLQRQLPDDLAVVQVLGVRVDPAERMHIPDLAVVAAADLRGDGSHVMANQLLLAVEITSPRTAADDRTSKVSGYAAGGVPLYLLIDRHAPEGPAVTLFSHPAGSTYRDSHQVPFGEPVYLSAPFDYDLPTDSFAQSKAQ
jgi:Uma2 family endonuclease